jgi:DNA-binding MarR family transcriptional regulator
MVDDSHNIVPLDNIRSLLQVVADALDERLKFYRRGTRFESVRPSDVRVFVQALRQPRSLSEMARILGISRQAVQMSVKRLSTLGVVALQASQSDSREKAVVITDRGMMARKAAQEQIKSFESECAAIIGTDGLETLRSLLGRLEVGLGGGLTVPAIATSVIDELPGRQSDPEIPVHN